MTDTMVSEGLFLLYHSPQIYNSLLVPGFREDERLFGMSHLGCKSPLMKISSQPSMSKMYEAISEALC